MNIKKIAFAAFVLAAAGAFAADGDAVARRQDGVLGYNIVRIPSQENTGTAFIQVSDTGDFQVHNFGTSNKGSSHYVVGYYTYTAPSNQSLTENQMLNYARNSYANGQYGEMATTTIGATGGNTAEEYKANTTEVEPGDGETVYASDYQVSTKSASEKVGFYLRHDDGTYQVVSHFDSNEDGLLTLYFDAAWARTGGNRWGMGASKYYAEQFIVFGEVAETHPAGTPLPGFLPTLLLGSLGLGGVSLRRFRKA